MMKLILICVVFFVGALIVFWFIQMSPKYELTYLRSPNSRHTVTRIDYDGGTYFTYGMHKTNNIPDSYIQPLYSGINSGFEAIFYFKGDTAMIYAHYGRFKSVGKNSLIKFKVYEGYGNDPLYYKMKYDKSGLYTVIHN